MMLLYTGWLYATWSYEHVLLNVLTNDQFADSVGPCLPDLLRTHSHTFALASLLLTMIKFGFTCACGLLHVVHVACWCLLQAAGALELAAQPTLRSSPLGVTEPRFLSCKAFCACVPVPMI